jgi:hypothetical protein
MGHHRRDTLRPPQASHHRHRSRRLLPGQHPLHFPRQLHAEQRQVEPGRQERLHLGRHRALLHRPVLDVHSGDEGQIIPRD